MARVWLVPTTWTGLAEKSTVAMPAATLAETLVLPWVRKVWRPVADSVPVGPSSRAPSTSVRVAFNVGSTGTFRYTGASVWVGATR